VSLKVKENHHLEGWGLSMLDARFKNLPVKALSLGGFFNMCASDAKHPPCCLKTPPVLAGIVFKGLIPSSCF
jgi:hypothetical protein